MGLSTSIGDSPIDVSYGQTDTNAIVVSGGAIASDMIVDNSGCEDLSSGGADAGTTISGGTMEVASGGATGTSAMTFANSSGGLLQLDDSTNFSGTISGFDGTDEPILDDISDESDTTLDFTEAGDYLSGTLTVTDGMQTADITLAGQYTALQFSLAPNGPGTVVLGPSASDPAVDTGVAGANTPPPRTVPGYVPDQQGAIEAPGHVAAALGLNAALESDFTGAGEKIGVISNSFNALGIGSEMEQDGALPTVTIATYDGITLDEAQGTSGADDEGAAMLEIVHTIAPDATLFFASPNPVNGGTVGDVGMADAVSALVSAGCNVIIDDYQQNTQPMFQEGGLVDNAISAGVQDGVSFFTAAANDYNAYYEDNFTPESVALPGFSGAVEKAQNFGGSPASPYLNFTLAADTTVHIVVQWAEPWGTLDGPNKNAADTAGFLGMQLYDSSDNLITTTSANGSANGLTWEWETINSSDDLATSTTGPYTGGVDPLQILALSNETGSAQTLNLAIYEDDSTTNLSSGEGALFEAFFQTNDFAEPVTVNTPTVFSLGDLTGWQLDPLENTIGAMPWYNTPAFAESAIGTLMEPTLYGPGFYALNANGEAIGTLATDGKVNLVGVDGDNTEDPKITPFFGSSAAAPSIGAVAALMLQANPRLTPAQVTLLLDYSATTIVDGQPLGPTAQIGDGLVQANLALVEAVALLIPPTTTTLAPITVSNGEKEAISDGQTTSGVHVLSGGEFEIISGATVSATTVSLGGIQAILSGTASNTIIDGGDEVVEAAGATIGSMDSGGTQYVFGAAIGTVLDIGASQLLSSGATIATIINSGTEVVYAVAFDTTIAGHGSAVVSSGGTASGTAVGNSGSLIVHSGGTISYTTIESGGSAVVSAGGTASRTYVDSGGVLVILSGGLASSTIVSSGGSESISAGGTDNGALISSGTQFVDGLASAGTAFSGGTENVASGGTASSTTISSGGTEIVSFGGTTIGTTLISGGTLEIFPGGTAIGTTSSGFTSGAVVSAGNSPLIVSSGQTDVGDSIVSGGTEIVSSGGTTSNATVSSGGQLVVANGGFADPTVISDGGRETINAGGTDYGAQVNGGGVQIVYGTASGSTISSTAADYVESGGVTDATILDSGGDEFVEAGGTASGTTANGGSQVLYGTASGTTLDSGSYLYLEPGTTVGTTVTSGVEVIYGTAIDTTDGSAGYDFVFSGGAASGTVLSGGEEYVETNASASGTVVDGGAQVVYGTATSTALNSGAYEYLEAGGTAIGTMVNSGVLVVYGIASGTTDQANGADYVYSGGTASGTTVSGGDEFVETGGTAIGTMVDGGAQVIYGTASGTVLNDGAEEYLESGTASGTTINNGLELVYGLAIATTVNSAGDEYIEAGGTTLGTTVSGGVAYVYAGALASGTVVDGGAQVLYSGGTAVGTTLNDGGYQYVYAGATASGTVVDSSGVLQVNLDGTALGTTVNGSGYDYINAGGTGSGTGVAGGGNEVVEVGGTALGTTASGTAADEFVYGTASGAVLVSGGEQVVEAGGTANATTAASGGYEYVVSGGIVSGASISGGTLELTSGAVDGNAPITFAGAGGLVLDAAELFSGTVAGFGSASLADTIDLRDIAYNSAITTKSYAGSALSGTLTVNNGSATLTANIALLGQYTAGSFTLASDGAGGTLLTDPPVSGSTALLAAAHA